MKLEQQVCSLELAKRLEELGVKQESHFRWCLWNSPNGAVIWDTQTPELATDLDVKSAFGIWDKGISAFTVAELGEMLPLRIGAKGKKDGRKIIAYFLDYQVAGLSVRCTHHLDTRQVLWEVAEDTEADARAKMLIYLLKNKLITV